MSPLPATSEIEAIARRVVWFEPPTQSLTDVARFLAYAMTYGDDADLREVRKYLSDDDLREALDRAPAGIIDPRSWAYWNLKLGRYPTPPMPERKLPATVG
jgi:hypothetical protein